jgi:hypothetical protein
METEAKTNWKPLGRPLEFPDKILLRLPENTRVRIKDILEEGENQADFCRAAIAERIARKEGRAR